MARTRWNRPSHMIAASLIPEGIEDDLPTDNEQKFYIIALAAREALLKRLHGDAPDLGPFSERSWQNQYFNEIEAVAAACQIAGLPTASQAASSSGNAGAFDQALTQILTSIRVRKPITNRSESVLLSVVTKSSIKEELERLRQKVNDSNLSDATKASLHVKIDAVEAELDKKRFGMKPTWILAGALALLTHASEAVSFASDLPGAVATVNSIIDSAHLEKDHESKQEERLNPPSLTYKAPLQITDNSNI